MLAKRIDIGADTLGDPAAAFWGRFPARKVSLVPTPVGLQNSKYVLAKWRDGEYGHARAAGLQCVHNGTEIAFRLEWECEKAAASVIDNDHFADAAALLFPLSDLAPLIMGAEGAPVSIWHWRGGRPEAARPHVATGIGTSSFTRNATTPVETKAVHHGGRWALVYRRALEARLPADDAAKFTPGGHHRLAVAVWSGANAERAGLKAYSPEWVELELEA